MGILSDIQLGIDNEDYSPEDRLKIADLMQKDTHCSDAGITCIMCRREMFYLPYPASVILPEATTPVAKGHVYSELGLKEMAMTQMCEYCWDEIFRDDE